MNLRHYFEAALRRAPHALALVDSEVRWSYSDLAYEVRCVTAGLQAEELQPGDRVMVLLRNCRENVVIFWVCQWLGLVYVPVSHHFALNDISYCIQDAEPQALFFDGASEARVHALAQQNVLPKRVYTVGIRATAPFKSFAHLRMALGHPCSQLHDSCDDAIALMFYSSAACGAPKGIPRSHLNEVSATMAHIIQNHYALGESTLALSGFYHTMGLRMLLAMTFLNGKLVLAPDDSAETHATLLAQERISCLYSFPCVYHDLLTKVHLYDVRTVKRIAYAGDTMSTELTRRCLAQFTPDSFVNHFGSSEIYTYTTCPWVAHKPCCAGRAGINTQLRLVAPAHSAATQPHDEVPPGEIGELIVKLSSPEAFKGYWNRPDLTRRAIRQGWYFTGNLVRVDAEGDLWIVGRVDDMLISAGEKVYPCGVEAVLRKHSKVKDVVVIGVADARVGKLLVAFVVPTDSSLTIGDLAQHCVASPALADFKRPAKFVLLDHIPRQGCKVLQSELVRLC
ncbi:MAG: AMP-binding protein [Ktedonobacteraceae bacterium]|nr:AMP-binding protein [Ktedonobacteraceae bacterium]